jgi:hypothetical protein
VSKILEHFDAGSLVVVLITFLLFMGALFTKGLTHDLLLEAGVFLVSVKLIIMAYKTNVSSKLSEQKLDEILALLDRLRNTRQMK